MNKIVVLDAGHGGKDSGAINGVEKESEWNLKICKIVESELKKNGVSVVMTRREDEYLTLDERVKIEKGFNADCFVSVHMNSAANKDAKGCEVFSYGRGSQDKLSEQIYKELKNVVGNGRGCKKDNFHVLRETKSAAILIECMFISNKEDVAMIKKKYKEVGKAIAIGILNYLGVKVVTVEKEGLYKVQVGAYSKKENAEKMLQDLKVKGFEGYIIKS